GRGAAAAERGPQTGDRGGVSYAGLVLDLDRAQGREQLLDEVVLLVVQGGPAEAAEPERAVQAPALVVEVLPAGVTGRQHAVGDHVHRRVEVEVLPLGPAGAAVADLLLPQRPGDQLLGRRAAGAQAAARDGAGGV